jgi:hypothetical protein
MHRFVVLAVGVAVALWAMTSFGQQDEEDRSGKGAVLCAWLFLIDIRNTIDICTPGRFGDSRGDVSWAIDAVNDFIVANNPTPVTRASLDEFIAKRLARARADVAAGDRATVNCENASTARSGPLFGESREEFRRNINDFLSVPRKPVMRPCL